MQVLDGSLKKTHKLDNFDALDKDGLSFTFNYFYFTSHYHDKHTINRYYCRIINTPPRIVLNNCRFPHHRHIYVYLPIQSF